MQNILPAKDRHSLLAMYVRRERYTLTFQTHVANRYDLVTYITPKLKKLHHIILNVTDVIWHINYRTKSFIKFKLKKIWDRETHNGCA